MENRKRLWKTEIIKKRFVQRFLGKIITFKISQERNHEESDENGDQMQRERKGINYGLPYEEFDTD